MLRLKTSALMLLLSTALHLSPPLHAQPTPPTTPPSLKSLLKSIDLNLELKQTEQARKNLKRAEQLAPDHQEVIARKAQYYFLMHQYPKAAEHDRLLLKKDPNSKIARAMLSDIREINPHLTYGLNEVGFNSEIDHVSDLRSTWQYTTLYYNRDTSFGFMSLNYNNASRLGQDGSQGVINLFPVITPNLFMRVNFGYANKPVIYPTYAAGGEVFYSGLAPTELSAGGTQNVIIHNIQFTQYTGSISESVGDFWLSFRPNFYNPARGPSSILYTGTLIKYFNTVDTFAKLTFGSGTMPDLANLTTVDFLKIKNTFVVGNVQLPLLDHQLLINLGFDYQHWTFPSQKIRDITGGLIGLNYRFEDHTG